MHSRPGFSSRSLPLSGLLPKEEPLYDRGRVIAMEMVFTLGGDVDNGPGSRSDGAGCGTGEGGSEGGAAEEDEDVGKDRRYQPPV